MSDDARWADMLRRIEQEEGRPLSADERDKLEKLRPEIERLRAKAKPEWLARLEARENGQLIAFMRKLMARQGTVMPDFEALYEKKADIDRRLLSDNDA